MCSVFDEAFYNVVGNDIDRQAIDHAQANYRDLSIEFHVMDTLHTSFADRNL